MRNRMYVRILSGGIMFGGFEYLHLLQVEAQFTNVSMLVTAVVTLAGTVGFLFYYSKSLNKAIKEREIEHGKEIADLNKTHKAEMKNMTDEYIKDLKDLVHKNLVAFNENNQILKEVQKKL